MALGYVLHSIYIGGTIFSPWDLFVRVRASQARILKVASKSSAGLVGLVCCMPYAVPAFWGLGFTAYM